MQKSVIVDIDGTLADVSHRLHYIQGKSKNWEAFFAECINDPVIAEIREVVNAFATQDYKIVLVSGRSDEVRELTEQWLNAHLIEFHELHMRRGGDYRQDFIVKSEILDTLLAAGHDILCVIDDRPSVVAMWRKRGLVCLQCRDWNEFPTAEKGLLTVMVGPSGAGKSTWLASENAEVYGIHPSHVVSSDQVRADICGDFRDQTKNDEVFSALHAVAKTRLSHGLPTVVDVTNLRRKDRLTVVALASGGPVRYMVIDRPMEEKVRDAGWRTELPFDLLAKHDQTFRSQIKAILLGDDQPNVKVIDLREGV